MTYQISDLQKACQKLHIEISMDYIRKLDKAGVIFCSRNLDNNYRELSSEQFQLSLKNILRYYFNIPLEVIKKADPIELEMWADYISKAVKQIR